MVSMLENRTGWKMGKVTLSVALLGSISLSVFLSVDGLVVILAVAKMPVCVAVKKSTWE
jgi:hypothetical protein